LKDVHLLDRAQFRLIAHPLRQQIVQMLCGEVLTTAQIAERIEGAPSNLYYHLDRLRAGGLIRVVRRRQVRGAVEKYYRAVASSFSAPPALLRTGAVPGQSDLLAAVEAMVQNALLRLAASETRGLIGDGAGQDMPMINSLTVRTSPARMGELRARLEQCIRDFHDAAASDDGESVEYALFDMLFPTRLAASEVAE
jgi:DNA-binding transcriptional ArsR family regulator